MSPTVYLISGANRGIGLGLVTSLALRDNVLIFAGARDPTRANDLKALAQSSPGKIHILKLTSADKADNLAAVAEIKKVAGKLDVVIANAAIAQYYGSSLDISDQQMIDHYKVNVVGPLTLFQATYPLLKESTLTPKFIPITSGAGSISHGPLIPVGMIPYSASKSALNFIARRWHVEFPELIVFPLDPGPTATDMTESSKESVEISKLGITFTSVDECVKGLLHEIDNATRESSGGQFVNHKGARLEW